MKNVIEVLFQFKDVGAEAIDQNREKLALMAKELQNTADQAGFIIESQKAMDKSIKESSKVNGEAAKEEKRLAKEKADQLKEEARLVKEKEKEVIASNKAEQKAAREAAAESKRIAKEIADINKARNADDKRIAAEAKQKQKAIADGLKAEAKLIADAAREEARIAKERKAAAKESDDIKKQELAKQREAAREFAANQKAQMKALREADLAERNALVEQMRLKNQKAKADKEAVLAANRAAREQERAGKVQAAAQKKVLDAQNKALAAANKANAAASKSAGKGGGSGGGTADVALLARANDQMKSSTSNLKLMKVGIAAAAAAAIAAVVMFARKSADEFYKMKLAAEQTGLDVRVIQEYKDVLDNVGISVDEFADKIRQMNEKFVEGFTENSGDGMEVLKTLNVDIEEFAKLAPEKKFEKFYEVTKKLSKEQKLQMFDKIGIDRLNLVYNRMDQIEEKKAQIQRTGLVITDKEAGRLKDFENSWNSFTNNLSTFSTIVYSSLIPATKDAFDGIFGGFEMTRNGANWFADVLIDVINWFARMANYGRLAFDLLIGKLKNIGLYGAQAAAGIGYLWDQMSLSLDTIIKKVKAIDLGVALADLAKKTFSGIIDLVYDSMSTIVSGIQSLAEKISGVIPDAVLENLKDTQDAIKKQRSKLFTYEKSEEQKVNDEKMKLIDIEAKKKSDVLDKSWEERKAFGKKELEENAKESDADILAFAKRKVKLDNMTNSKYLTTMEEATKENEKEAGGLVQMLDATEERNKAIDKLMEEAENIKMKIELGILNNGVAFTADDFMKKYVEAIDIAKEDTKLVNKELTLRTKQVEELNTLKDKSMQGIKDKIDALKLLAELDPTSYGKNKDRIIAGYNEMIALAQSQGKKESEINAIIKERNDYQQTFIDNQQDINDKLRSMETALLAAQGKTAEIRKRRRQDELKATSEMLKNATEEERKNGLSLTNSLLDITDAKERIDEISTELDKLIEKRDTQTSLFDRTQLLELEEQINGKMKERTELEDQLGIKRRKANDEFLLTLGQVKDILNTTYTNLSTLITSSVTGVNTLKDAVANFFQSTLQYIAQLLQQLIVMKAMGFLSDTYGLSSGVGALAGTGASAAGGSGLPGFAVGGTVSAKGGTGEFLSMGSLKAGEVNAILHDKEAVLTKSHQNSLGNYIGGLQDQLANSSGGSTVQNQIDVNISAESLMDSIGKTPGFNDAVQLSVTRNKQAFKQLLNN